MQSITGQPAGLPKEAVGRRSFLLAGAAALGTTARSYGRIIGANERIALGHIGIGNRGRELASIAADLKGSHNVEIFSQLLGLDAVEMATLRASGVI